MSFFFTDPSLNPIQTKQILPVVFYLKLNLEHLNFFEIGINVTIAMLAFCSCIIGSYESVKSLVLMFIQHQFEW